MKKFSAILCAIALLVSLSACQTAEAPTSNESTAATTEAVPETTTQHPEPTTAEEAPTEPSTPALSFGTPSALTFRDESGTIYATGLVPVTNESTQPVRLPLGTMEFSDTDGNVVGIAEAVFAFPNVIAPGETAYYYDQITPELGDVGELTLTLTAGDAETDTLVRYDILTEKIMLRDSPYGGLSMTGQMHNGTDTECTMACIAAVLYDAEGAVTAVLYTYLMDPLPSQTTVDFTIESFTLPDDLTAQAVADYEVFAYPVG